MFSLFAISHPAELNGCGERGAQGSLLGQYFKAFKILRMIRLVKLIGLMKFNRLLQRYQVKARCCLPLSSETVNMRSVRCMFDLA